MTRTQQIASAIQANDPSLDHKSMQAAIVAVKSRPNNQAWTAESLLQRFGAELVEGVIKQAPQVIPYLAKGINFNDDRVKARLVKGGDLRAELGEDAADMLLSLGETLYSDWTEAGGDPDKLPTVEEVAEVRATVVLAETLMCRVLEAWNSVANAYHAGELTQAKYDELIGGLR